MKKFYDFFDIEYGQRDYTSKRFLEKHPGTVPLISSKGINNGIFGFFDIKPKYKNILTVPRTGSIGMAFYQDFDCCVDDNCLVLTPKINFKNVEMLYFAQLIRQNKYRFVYGRQITPNRLGNILIPDKFPEWLNTINIIDTTKLKEPYLKTNIDLKTKEWHWFKLEDLFEFKKGKRLTKANMVKGNTPFIGAIDKNNGYREFIGQKPNHLGNTITVNYNGSVAEAFYQPLPFWASDDVNVLYPKFKMNQFNALFITTLIKLEKYRFNYGRKWHLERMKISEIKLPTKDKKPDFKYMENFIKTLNYSKQI